MPPPLPPDVQVALMSDAQGRRLAVEDVVPPLDWAAHALRSVATWVALLDSSYEVGRGGVGEG